MSKVILSVISLLMLAAQASALPLSGLLGVANKVDGTASLINVTNGETKTIKVGRMPHEIAFGKGYAYVSNYGSAHIRSSDLRDQPGNTISVIQLSPPYAVTEIDLGPARCAPHGLVASRDGRHLYATCEGRHEIAVVDLIQGRISHVIPTNQAGSHLIVLSSDESRAYVSNFWHGTVSVLDLKARRLIKQIRTGRGSEGIGISADDLSLFVSRVEDGEIVKVDTRTLEVVQRKVLGAGSSPIRVLAGPRDQILVNDVASGTLRILNANDLSEIRKIKVGRQPIGLATSEGDYAFAANMKDNTISAINLRTGQVEVQWPTGNAPDGIAYNR